MSTLVPNCTITYPKDLSRLYLNINAIEFPNIYTGVPSDIRLTITKDGQPTLVTNLPIINSLIPFHVLSGTINKSDFSNTIIGVGTSFLTDIKVGDVIQMQSSYNPYLIVDSIVSNTELVSKSLMTEYETAIGCGVIRPIIEVLAGDLFSGSTMLIDGNYEVYISYDTNINVIPFTKYVFANEYKCVESKLMSLALYCSEGCVDMETLKYTLLLKALLDSMETILSEDVVDTTALSLVKEKINRYCLLLNNNCTSC
jgi:hypothetical protein